MYPTNQEPGFKVRAEYPYLLDPEEEEDLIYVNTRERDGNYLSTSGEYFEYLHSEYWGQVREAVLSRDKKCVDCGSIYDLQAHHKVYVKRFTELNHLNCLTTLCKKCHRTEHERLGTKMEG